MSVKFFSLRSGSSGNCYYFGNEREAFLVDMGVGPRILTRKLREAGLDMGKISFMLVTHDHIDHIKHLGGFAKRFQLPVYAPDRLHRSLDTHPCTRGCMSGCRYVIDEASFLDTGNIKVKAFRVPHDATVTYGYHIDFYGERITIITDAGDVTQEMLRYAAIAKHLVIESNYDLDMLMSGPYSPELKRRIISGHGHLSNEQTSYIIERICASEKSPAKNIFLCHISDNNNTPELAYKASQEALRRIGKESSVNLAALPRKTNSPIFEL